MATLAAAPEPARYSRREILIATAGIQLAILLAALDQTIVNPALTAISTDLHAVDHLSWIIVGYFLTSTALTPIYGKLSDLYGRGKLMLIAIAFFVIASALCGFASSLTQLTIFRALQGIGGGGLMVTAQAMIADFISPRERGKYQAFTASTWAFAGIAGPVVGGLFADHLTWRWIFWINVPLGILALIFVLRVSRGLVLPKARKVSIDYTGAVLLVIGVTLALLALSQSNAGWGTTEYAYAFGGTFFLIAFVLQERRALDPILPPRLYRNRVILWTNIIGFLLTTVQFAALVLLPVFFQLVLGQSATGSGFMIIPMLVVVPMASIVAGQTMSRTGRYRAIFPIAFTVMTAAFIMLSRTSDTTPIPYVEVAVLLLGFGVGLCGPVLMTSTQNAAEPGDIGAATSSVSFTRAVGASFGTAIFWSILLVPLSGAAAGAAQTLFHEGHRGLATLAPAERSMVFHLLLTGFHNVFAVAAAIAAATAIFALFLQELPLKTKPRTAPGKPAEAVLMEQLD